MANTTIEQDAEAFFALQCRGRYKTFRKGCANHGTATFLGQLLDLTPEENAFFCTDPLKKFINTVDDDIGHKYHTRVRYTPSLQLDTNPISQLVVALITPCARDPRYQFCSCARGDGGGCDPFISLLDLDGVVGDKIRLIVTLLQGGTRFKDISKKRLTEDLCMRAVFCYNGLIGTVSEQMRTLNVVVASLLIGGGADYQHFKGAVLPKYEQSTPNVTLGRDGRDADQLNNRHTWKYDFNGNIKAINDTFGVDIVAIVASHCERKAAL